MTDDPLPSPRTAEDLYDPERKPEEKFLDKPQRAADPKALREKAISDKQKALQDENDLRAVLATPEGVRFVARIIGGPCGWNLPHFNANNSTMSEVAGRRSIAWQIEGWICDVDLGLWFAVRRELEKNRPKPVKEAKRSG